MMKRKVSPNEEAYKCTDVSYFSRFNRDIWYAWKSATDFGFRYATWKHGSKLTIDNILLQVSLSYLWT